MKTTQLFVVALLGLAVSLSAHAQTPVVGTPSAPLAPTSPILMGSTAPETAVPGTSGRPADATTPLGASGERYQARRAPIPRAVDVGGVAPARAADGSTLRSKRPVRRAKKIRARTAPVRY